jgi:hypothetical protein
MEMTNKKGNISQRWQGEKNTDPSKRTSRDT